MRLCRWFAAGLLTLAIAGSQQPAFSAPVQDDLQLWTPVILEIPVPHQFRVTLEAQPRIANNISDLATILLRPSLTLDVNRHLSLTAGYLWSPVIPPDDAPDDLTTRIEQRLWQQIMITHALKKLRVNHLFRLEERFIEGQGEVAFRGHHLLRVQCPLGKTHWSWINSHEILVHLNDTRTISAGYNQERLFTGLRRTFKNNAFIESGYMLQFVNVRAPGRDQLNHNLIVRLNIPLGRGGSATSPPGNGLGPQQPQPPPHPHGAKHSPIILD